MKKEKTNYLSPYARTMEVVVRSVIATSLLGSTEDYGYDTGSVDDGVNAETYGSQGGIW